MANSSANEQQPFKSSMQEPDILTRLQTCLDQLATQFAASISYIATHHPMPGSQTPQAPQTPGAAPGPGATSTNPVSTSNNQEPSTAGANTINSNNNNNGNNGNNKDPTNAAGPPSPAISESFRPDPPPLFQSSTRELARDLVIKQKEIEALIKQLPQDLVVAEEAQDRRIVELEKELREMGDRAGRVKEERERLLERVEGAIGWLGSHGCGMG